MFDSLSVVFSGFRFFLLFTVLTSSLGNVYGIGLGGSGIIPYTLKKGRAYIFLGQDSWTQTWSNFGGGYDEGKDKSLDDTAAREGFEETMGVFSKPEAKDPNPEKNETVGIAFFKKLFNDDYTVYRNRQPAIFFVHVPHVKPSHFKRVLRRLKQRKASERFLEKDAFAWVRLSRLQRAIEKAKPYIKVSQKCTSWSSKEYQENNRVITLGDKFITGLYTNNLNHDQVFNIFSYIQAKCDFYYGTRALDQKEIAASSKSD